MKTLALVLVLLAVVIAGLGFYRGWFSLASKSADAKSKITLTVDKDKFQDDRKAATESVENLGSSAADTIGDKEDETLTTHSHLATGQSSESQTETIQEE